MVAFGRLRRFWQDLPMQSNALLYTGYATAATLMVHTSEQWQEQPMNARKRDCEKLSKAEGPTGLTSWKWSWQYRSGNDANLIPVKDPSEPYYNLAISAHSACPPEEVPRQKSTKVPCKSVQETVQCCEAHAGYKPTSQTLECTFNIDLARLAGMVLFSSCFNGPAYALLYPFYHRVFGATSVGVNRSVLFDQTFYTPFVAIPACWYLNGFVKKWAMRDPRLDDSKEGWNVEDPHSSYSIQDFLVETTNDMKENWVSTVLMSMAIWFPAESINLRFTPVHLRSAVGGAVGLLWTAGMAAWTHAGSPRLMESTKESVMESSVTSNMESFVAIKNLLERAINADSI
jgi:hypothetical protein